VVLEGEEGKVGRRARGRGSGDGGRFLEGMGSHARKEIERVRSYLSRRLASVKGWEGSRAREELRIESWHSDTSATMHHLRHCIKSWPEPGLHLSGIRTQIRDTVVKCCGIDCLVCYVFLIDLLHHSYLLSKPKNIRTP